jgi:carbonic anhydrase
MTLLNNVLEHNARWVEARLRPLSKVPQKKVVLFTCMARLVEFLEQAMGLGRGDAQVIKNAGNTLVDPVGGVVRGSGKRLGSMPIS